MFNLWPSFYLIESKYNRFFMPLWSSIPFAYVTPGGETVAHSIWKIDT
jgi:hypothetical protein